MGIFDSFRKSKEKEKAPHTTPPPPGHTLTEVLQDKNKSHLFGELLKRDGNEDLALRLASGKLEESDIFYLEQQRKIFSEKMTQSEKIEALLTKDNVIEFARNHPEFEKVINLLGPEKAIKVIQGQLKNISITDEYRFNSIASAIETYEGYRTGELKTVNDKVEKLCKDKKITPKEYLDALAITDPEEKERVLRELSDRTYSGFSKAINFISRGAFKKNSTLEDLRYSEFLMETSIDELNAYQNNIGAALFASLSGNEEMRSSLFSGLLNEKATEEAKPGFKDAKKESASNTFTEKKFNEDWEAYKKASGYETASALDQDATKDAFIEEQKGKYQEKNKQAQGFWASIFTTLLEEMINNKKAELN